VKVCVASRDAETMRVRDFLFSAGRLIRTQIASEGHGAVISPYFGPNPPHM
jgi:hypothetical protein